MYNKTIIEFGFRIISWFIKTSCLCCLPQPSAQTSVLMIHDIMLNLIQKLFIMPIDYAWITCMST